jgi:cyclophilin family peptidyl-prolyl cis-trans isomerase
MVLIAAGGLVLAVILAIGFMLGRDTATTDTTAQDAAEQPLGEEAMDEIELPTMAAPDSETASDAAEGDAEGDAADDAEGDATDDTDADDAAKDDADGGADDDADADAAGDDEADGGDTVLYVPGGGDPYSAPDDMGLAAGEKSYFATIETDRGTIVMELWPEVAPAHVNAFAFLATEGFYDGLTFHRVEPGFVIQGGDPLGNGSGGPGYGLPAEFNEDNPVPHRVGTLAMARSGDPDSGGSQFYIVLADGPGPSSLDGQYTVFGHVIEGMDAVQAIRVGDVMTSVTFEEKDISERVVSPDDIRDGTLPEGVTGAGSE